MSGRNTLFEPLQITDPSSSTNPLLQGTPSQGQALGDLYTAAIAERERQMQISRERGLWTGGEVWEGGHPTAKGVVDIGGQYANALVMGTTAPKGADLKSWFGKSVYTDAKGSPVTMYHGSKGSFDEFRANLTPDDHVPGISVTPHPEEAASYGTPRQVYVKAEKPMDYRQLDDWAAARAGKTDDPDFSAFDIEPKTLLKWLKEDGYDAIDYTSDPMLGYGIRVFDPAQLRLGK